MEKKKTPNAKPKPRTKGKKGITQAVQVVEQIGTEEAADTLTSAVKIVQEEYGDFKLSKSMKMKLAQDLNESEEVIDGWQRVSDVLDHIDMVALAQRHPEAIGKIAGTIVSVLSLFYPVVGTVGMLMPQEFLTKVVEFSGMLTPEHIANIIVKKQIERKKRRQSERLASGETSVPINSEEPDDYVTIDEPENDASDETAAVPAEVVMSAQGQQQKGSGVFGSIRQKVSDGSKAVVSGGKKIAEKGSGIFRSKPKQEDIFESIRKLAQLRDCGAITEEEFETKKAELLARI